VNRDGLSVFDLLRYRQQDHAAVLCAFDLIALDGKDLRRAPLEERRHGLANVLFKERDGIIFNRHFDGDGAIIFREACALGCEGIVSKRLGSLYRSGRVNDWLKIKNPKAPAVKREAEEDWGESDGRACGAEDNARDSPPPAAMDLRGPQRRVLHREGRQRPGGGLGLLRGRTRPASGSQPRDQGRGAADCDQHREAAVVINSHFEVFQHFQRFGQVGIHVGHLAKIARRHAPFHLSTDIAPNPLKLAHECKLNNTA